MITVKGIVFLIFLPVKDSPHSFSEFPNQYAVATEVNECLYSWFGRDPKRTWTWSGSSSQSSSFLSYFALSVGKGKSEDSPPAEEVQGVGMGDPWDAGPIPIPPQPATSPSPWDTYLPESSKCVCLYSTYFRNAALCAFACTFPILFSSLCWKENVLQDLSLSAGSYDEGLFDWYSCPCI